MDGTLLSKGFNFAVMHIFSSADWIGQYESDYGPDTVYIMRICCGLTSDIMFELSKKTLQFKTLVTVIVDW